MIDIIKYIQVHFLDSLSTEESVSFIRSCLINLLIVMVNIFWVMNCFVHKYLINWNFNFVINQKNQVKDKKSKDNDLVLPDFEMDESAEENDDHRRNSDEKDRKVTSGSKLTRVNSLAFAANKATEKLCN